MTKILIDEATVKLVLEYLEESDNYLGSLDHSKPIAALKALADQPAQQELTNIERHERNVQKFLAEQPSQQEFVSPGGGYVPAIPAQQALDKKAENAKDLGLDYEPLAETQVSKVWWDGEKLMAKPIPFVEFYKPAQRTWVGLTKTMVGNHLRRHALGEQPTFRQGFKEGVAFAELKLKDKNT